MVMIMHLGLSNKFEQEMQTAFYGGGFRLTTFESRYFFITVCLYFLESPRLFRVRA